MQFVNAKVAKEAGLLHLWREQPPFNKTLTPIPAPIPGSDRV
jgi:hypothetical protein